MMMIANAVVGRPVASGAKMASLDARRLNLKGNVPVELVFDGVRKTNASLQVRVLLSSDSMEAIEAGRIYTYGEGPAGGSNADERFTPMRLSLDITKAVRELSGSSHVDVQVQLLDGQGREVDEPFFVDTIQLHLRESDGINS